MRLKAVKLTLLLLTAATGARGIDNGLGRRPPMGWRSWNCWGLDVTDAKMRRVVDAMTSRSRLVGGESPGCQTASAL